MHKLISILENARNTIDDQNPYMCWAIVYSFKDHGNPIDPSLLSLYIPWFTREDYHDFISTRYPNLTKYLLCEGSAWITMFGMTPATKALIIQSKKDFLQSIIDKYDSLGNN